MQPGSSDSNLTLSPHQKLLAWPRLLMQKVHAFEQDLLQCSLSLLARSGSQVSDRRFFWKQFNSPEQSSLLGIQSKPEGWADDQRCFVGVSWAMQQLQAKDDREAWKQIADLIIECMTHPNRCFHSPSHIFEVVDGGDAIEVLAALFHDIVYVQVDDGINVNVSRYVVPFVKEVRGRLQIRPSQEIPDDRGFELVATVFDVQPDQHLAFEQNEFLSALVAIKCLESILGEVALAQLAACIEATIPFRPPFPSGLTPAERLHRNLAHANERFNLGMDEQRLIHATQRAIRLANRDVSNFAESQASRFLNNTWKLLPETNPVLRDSSTYTVRHYRNALERMGSFMHFLDPTLVFRQFKEEPSHAAYQDLCQRANKNIIVARLYLDVKLVAIAILEALSLRLGDDVPLLSLVGQCSPNSGIVLWQTRLPKPALQNFSTSAIEQEVMELLEFGRTQESGFDIKNSPLATFLVKSCGFDAVLELLAEAKSFFQGKISADQFLLQCDQTVVSAVKAAILQELESRRIALLESI